MTLETIGAADFRDLVGRVLAVRVAGPDGQAREIPLTLSGVGEGTPTGSEFREPFSLDLVGPADQPLGQGVYEVAHPTLGALELFIVPHGPGADGPTYSITFA